MNRLLPGSGRLACAGVLVLALGAVTVVTGCADLSREAEIYRVQRGYWKAYRAGQEAVLSGTAADSTQLLALRLNFIKAVDEAAPTIRVMGAGKKRSALDTRLLRVVGHGEVQAAEIAMNAGRPDLVLDRCRVLIQHAEGDTAVTRQADILIAGALRKMGRHEEAIDAMREMLVRYPPRAPDSTGVEDFVLTLPTLITATRKDLGDEAGARRELEFGKRYYQGLIAGGGLDPRLEAQVRLHLVHNELELGQKAEALAALDAAEEVVMRERSLAASIPEIRYTRVKLTALESKDPSAPVSTLERIAFDFPQSPVAPLALFDAAVLNEKSSRYELARAGYEAVAARYPRSAETASTALLRQALLEDRLGQWEKSKAILESIPTKYPYSAAGAEAPLSAAEHYFRERDASSTKTALRRAVEIYTRMIAWDSLASTTPRLRWNLCRAYATLGDTQGVFRAVDGLVSASPDSPLTAGALLQGAKVAEGNGLKGKAAAYLNQFLQMYPDSPQAPTVRAELRELAK